MVRGLLVLVFVVLGIGLWKASGEAANSRIAEAGEQARVDLGPQTPNAVAAKDAVARETLAAVLNNPKNGPRDQSLLLQLAIGFDVGNGDHGVVTQRDNSWTEVRFTTGVATGKTGWLPAADVLKDN